MRERSRRIAKPGGARGARSTERTPQRTITQERTQGAGQGYGMTWSDEPATRVGDDFGRASHVRRHHWHPGAQRFRKYDPEGLRLGVRLCQEVCACQQPIDIAPFTQKFHARLESMLPNVI